MKKIGLTGGIASGKSTVSDMLRDVGALIIDADLVAREIVAPGSQALTEIGAEFGDQVIDESGVLRRDLLSKIVFNNPEKLNKLNEITHSRIISTIESRIQSYEMAGEQLIFLDAALLIELELGYLVDEIWLIVIDKNLQIERLMNRESMSRNDALKIIDSQMPLEEKKAKADVLIDNSDSVEKLKENLKDRWHKLTEEA